MRFSTSFRRAAWVSVLSLLVAGGLSLAGPQEKKSEEASKDPEASRPAGEQEATTDATDEAKTPGLNTPKAAAGMLRDQGKIISQTGDLKIAVDSNLFTTFPGFELGHLSTTQRDKLIKQANAVYCTCGCRGDTIARCVVLDPSCQVARKVLQRMLDDVTSATAEPKAEKSTGTE